MRKATVTPRRTTKGSTPKMTVTEPKTMREDDILAQADKMPPPLDRVEQAFLADNPPDGLADEPSDVVLELGMSKGTELKRLMRPGLHGVYVMNIPAVRDNYEAAGYKSAKAGSGWVTNENAFQTNDKGELTYGDCVIMVVTQRAFESLMARQKARRHAEIAGRGGELRTTKGAPPPPDPEDE